MIDPTEAPEGMIAVESKDISGSVDCHYEGSYVCPRTADNLLQCVSHNRKDRCDVVFIKKPPETGPPAPPRTVDQLGHALATFKPDMQYGEAINLAKDISRAFPGVFK